MEDPFFLGLDSEGEAEPYNVLPYDGEAIYYGRHLVTARKVAWFGDRDFDYTYSGRTRIASPWTPELLEMKRKVEQLAGARYNSCLLNLYADGSQGMAWHHDDEKGLGKRSNIASASLAARRRFDLRHKRDREKVSVQLEHGSLLVMRGATQACWQHQIPKTARISAPRVNLTFRRMVDLQQPGSQPAIRAGVIGKGR